MNHEITYDVVTKGYLRPHCPAFETLGRNTLAVPPLSGVPGNIYRRSKKYVQKRFVLMKVNVSQQIKSIRTGHLHQLRSKNQAWKTSVRNKLSSARFLSERISKYISNIGI